MCFAKAGVEVSNLSVIHVHVQPPTLVSSGLEISKSSSS